MAFTDKIVELKGDVVQPSVFLSFAMEASLIIRSAASASVLICDGYNSARAIYEALVFFGANSEERFPCRHGKRVFLCEDLIPLSTFYDIKNISDPVLVLTPNAFFSGVPDYESISKSRIVFRNGARFSRDSLVAAFNDFGYERVGRVETINEFSVRGEIIDFYPQESPYPVRIDFFDEIIESIKYFNINTQRSFEEIDRFALFPGDQEYYDRKLNILDAVSNPTVFIETPFRAMQDFLNIESNALFYESGIKNAVRVYEFDTVKRLINFPGNIMDKSGYGTVKFNDPGTAHFAKNLKFKNGKLNFNLIKKILSELFKKEYRIILSVKNDIHLERIKTIFNSAGINVKETASAFSILKSGIYAGIISKRNRLLVFTGEELFREHINTIDKDTSGRRFDYFETARDINYGDFVVHSDFGIAKFLGIKKIFANGRDSDYFELLFDGGDKIYLPADKIYLLHKYIASESESQPKLNKLGNDVWKKNKKRAKDRIEKIAEDLKLLYAKRAAHRGFAFSSDDESLREFEEGFEFEETNDQAKAINDVISDMRMAKPMDRLICGDAGFGKTEVALRASFKAGMDGKQVAFLAPTTILVEQHYNNFSKRLEQYPLNVAFFSRFTGKKDERHIIDGIRSGDIDIIIGTHKLLSDKIKYHDLGLLIIDEEQKFGAMQKEKIKKLRSDIDVLALSATPIPRTLYLSLSGIRDLSIINTPPAGRKNVITNIIDYDADIIKQAILKEIKRGGQIYFITDKISRMEENFKRLSGMIPDIRIGIVHGRLNPQEIEDIMHVFYKKGYDLLLSTSIIESGLDNPNVNLIIINNAENFGMSGLYQLRGRVGRSHIQAYCYLIAGVGTANLNASQYKRLNSLKEYSETGSGFELSMADLEIRGAGNILGGAQSGHIDAVGLEMCMQMLNEEIERIKGVTLPPVVNPEVQTDLPAFIPDYYIGEGKEKLTVYRKLSNCMNLEELSDLREELEDRFGKYPVEVDNLLFIESLKVLMRNSRVQLLKLGKDEINLDFHGSAAEFTEKLIHFINDKDIAGSFTVKIAGGERKNEGNALVVKLKSKEKKEGYEGAKFVLQRLYSYVNIK